MCWRGTFAHQGKVRHRPPAAGGQGHGGQDSPAFITDGLDQYHIAFKRVFRTLKGPISIHIRDTHIRNLICNTNKQERLNGGSLAASATPAA